MLQASTINSLIRFFTKIIKFLVHIVHIGIHLHAYINILECAEKHCSDRAT